MSVRYDFQCPEGHEFVLWSDDARLCPTCGSEFLKRIFVTAPAVGNSTSKAVENLVRNELDSRGISDLKTSGKAGDQAKVTYQSTPADLEARKIMREYSMPQKPDGLDQIKKQVVNTYSASFQKGGITAVGPGKAAGAPDLIRQVRRFDPIGRRTLRIKDPENLKLPK